MENPELQPNQPTAEQAHEQVADIDYTEYSAIRALARRLAHPFQTISDTLHQISVGLGDNHHRY